jgi:hypothetical protein
VWVGAQRNACARSYKGAERAPPTWARFAAVSAAQCFAGEGAGAFKGCAAGVCGLYVGAGGGGGGPPGEPGVVGEGAGGAAPGAAGATRGGPSVPQSQGPNALPSGRQDWPPSHLPGPMQAWVAPGTQALGGSDGGAVGAGTRFAAATELPLAAGALLAAGAGVILSSS